MSTLLAAAANRAFLNDEILSPQPPLQRQVRPLFRCRRRSRLLQRSAASCRASRTSSAACARSSRPRPTRSSSPSARPSCCSRSAGKQKPALVLRTDVANVYGSELPRALFSRMIGNAVEQAVRLDATCVVVNLFRIPGQPEVTDQCIENILRAQARVRALVHAADDRAARLPPERTGRRLHGRWRSWERSCRSCARPWSSAPISSRPTRPTTWAFTHKVVEIAGRIPVLVRGGGKAPDAEILDRTEKLIQQGAAGIVYGRNIIQHAQSRRDDARAHGDRARRRDRQGSRGVSERQVTAPIKAVP